MCELYNLPEFMTLPRGYVSTDKIERHYHRMRQRLDFIVENKCCDGAQYDAWLSILDQWLADALACASKGGK